MQPCSQFGTEPICAQSYFVIGDDYKINPAEIRSVQWFQDDLNTRPWPAAGRNLRSGAAFAPYWAMAVAGGNNEPVKVNVATLFRDPAAGGGPNARSVGAKVVLSTGLVQELSADFIFRAGLLRDPEDPVLCPPTRPDVKPKPECHYAGIKRTPPPPLAVCAGAPQPPRRCKHSGVYTYQPFGYMDLVGVLYEMCPDSVLRVPAYAFLNPLPPVAPATITPLEFIQRNVTLLAANDMVIDYSNALPNSPCLLRIFGPHTKLINVIVQGDAGTCVCADANEGVELVKFGMAGYYANLKIEEGAGISSLKNISCDQGMMADFCIINSGTINSIDGARFAADVKFGAIMNYGTIRTVTNSLFRNHYGDARGDCAAASAVFVHAAGAMMVSMENNIFAQTLAGRALWVDGHIVKGISNNEFRAMTDGAIAVGPSGYVKTISKNIFQGVTSYDSGSGILNWGEIDLIQENFFGTIDAASGGAAISNEYDTTPIDACGVYIAPATIKTGIISNEFDSVEGGGTCSGVISIQGGKVGPFDETWANITNQAYPIPAAPAAWHGITDNTFRIGTALDPGTAIGNKGGKVSMIVNNKVNNKLAPSRMSGGGIDNGGAVALVANNLIDGFNNAYYGAFTCEVPYYAQGPMAVIKLVRNNSLEYIPKDQDGGCVYIGTTCTIQWMINNRCTRYATPTGTIYPTGFYFEARAVPTARTEPTATVCTMSGNTMDRRPVSMPRLPGVRPDTRPGSGPCPTVDKSGWFFQGPPGV